MASLGLHEHKVEWSKFEPFHSTIDWGRYFKIDNWVYKKLCNWLLWWYAGFS